MPVIQSPHKGKEFAVMDIVVMFCVGKGLRVETNCGVFAPMIFLSEYSARGEGGGVDLKKEQFRGIRLK